MKAEPGDLALEWGMATLADDRPRTPEPAGPLPVIACFLELGVVGTFIVHRSWCGLALCLGYAWYSACWWIVFRRDS